jgi:hypothetical protein
MERGNIYLTPLFLFQYETAHLSMDSIGNGSRPNRYWRNIRVLFQLNALHLNQAGNVGLENQHHIQTVLAWLALTLDPEH